MLQPNFYYYRSNRTTRMMCTCMWIGIESQLVAIYKLCLCLSVCLHVCPSFCSSFVYLYDCLCVCLSVYLSVFLPILAYVCPNIELYMAYVCLDVCMYVCLFVHRSVIKLVEMYIQKRYYNCKFLVSYIHFVLYCLLSFTKFNKASIQSISSVIQPT